MRIFFIIFFFFVSLPVFSYEYFPAYNNSTLYYGNGVISVSGKFPVFSSPDSDSEIIFYVNSDSAAFKRKSQNKLYVEDVFIAYSNDKNIALLPVREDNDEWFCICYSQDKKLFGWIKKSENIDYMSWHDFFNVYGRKNGVSFFKNVGEKYKKLYSQPNEESSLVDEFYAAKHISLWLVSGDWILVKVTTYDGLLKTGWLRWRLKDGSIAAFPDFNSF